MSSEELANLKMQATAMKRARAARGPVLGATETQANGSVGVSASGPTADSSSSSAAGKTEVKFKCPITGEVMPSVLIACAPARTHTACHGFETYASDAEYRLD